MMTTDNHSADDSPLDASDEAQTGTIDSNSVSQAPDLGVAPRPLSEVLGIDYLTLKFPVEWPDAKRFDQESTHRRTASQRFRRGLDTVLRVAEGFDVDLHAYKVPDHGWCTAMYFNPSRHPANQGRWTALPLALLPRVLDDVWESFEQIVTPTIPCERASVARIDIARDFQLTPSMLNAVLKALPNHDAPRATRRSVFHSSRGMPETCNSGTASRGMARAYDHAALHGSPSGTLRTEVEVRSGWLAAYGGITTLDDMTAARIEALFMDRFEYAGFHLPVVHSAVRLEKLVALALGPDPILSERMLPGFLGREMLAQHGIDWGAGNSTASTQRKVNERVGLPHDFTNAARVFRLDPRYDRPLVEAP